MDNYPVDLLIEVFGFSELMIMGEPAMNLLREKVTLQLQNSTNPVVENLLVHLHTERLGERFAVIPSSLWIKVQAMNRNLSAEEETTIRSCIVNGIDEWKIETAEISTNDRRFQRYQEAANNLKVHLAITSPQ